MGAKQSQLSPGDLNSLVHETNFTPKEIEEFHKQYKKESQKGRMTKDSLIKLYKKTFPKGDPTAIVDELLRAYDVDKDGTIDFREFLVSLAAAQKATDDEKLRLAFEIVDIDGNGYITNPEMHQLVRAIYKAQTYGKYDEKVADTVGALMFQQLDKNKDNKITYNEFVEGAKKDPSIMRLLQVKIDPKKK